MYHGNQGQNVERRAHRVRRESSVPPYKCTAFVVSLLYVQTKRAILLFIVSEAL